MKNPLILNRKYIDSFIEFMVDFPASHFSLRGVTDIVLLRVGAGYPSNVKQHSQQRQRISRTYTPPKFNMEPKNNGFQKGISYSRVPFSGEPC